MLTATTLVITPAFSGTCAKADARLPRTTTAQRLAAEIVEHQHDRLALPEQVPGLDRPRPAHPEAGHPEQISAGMLLESQIGEAGRARPIAPPPVPAAMRTVSEPRNDPQPAHRAVSGQSGMPCSSNPALASSIGRWTIPFSRSIQP